MADIPGPALAVLAPAQAITLWAFNPEMLVCRMHTSQHVFGMLALVRAVTIGAFSPEY